MDRPFHLENQTEMRGTGVLMSTSPLPAWCELRDVPDPRARLLEEQVEMRRHTKHLKDCWLPEGFKLENAEPRPLRMDGQVRLAFVLSWSDGLGRSPYYFAARYEQTIPDEPQMQWALEEFAMELEAAGLILVGNAKTWAHPKVA